jgi:hypothetical protein
MRGVLFDDAGVERPIQPQSRLAQEREACQHDVARHFLEELPKHCTMLTVAVLDGLGSLARLDGSRPFGAVVVARGLLECTADLYWLSASDIDAAERTRRTFNVVLRQQETVVRQLVESAKRVPPHAQEIVKLQTAIGQGWEPLKTTADAMASAGYELYTSNKPGSKYVLGKAKPAIGALIDRLVTDHLGTTAVSLVVPTVAIFVVFVAATAISFLPRRVSVIVIVSATVHVAAAAPVQRAGTLAVVLLTVARPAVACRPDGTHRGRPPPQGWRNCHHRLRYRPSSACTAPHSARWRPHRWGSGCAWSTT